MHLELLKKAIILEQLIFPIKQNSTKFLLQYKKENQVTFAADSANLSNPIRLFQVIFLIDFSSILLKVIESNTSMITIYEE